MPLIIEPLEYVRMLVAALALVLIAVKAWQVTYYWADYREVHDPLRRSKILELAGGIVVYLSVAAGSIVTLLEHQPVTWRAFALAFGMLLQAVGLWTLTHKERHVLREWDRKRGRRS